MNCWTNRQNGAVRLLPLGETIASLSEFFLAYGFSGHHPWSSHGVDMSGSLTDFGAAAFAFQQVHPSVVRFLATGTAQTISFPAVAPQNWLDSHLTVTLSDSTASQVSTTVIVTDGQSSSPSSNSTRSSGGCGLGGMVTVLALMMFGLFQRSLQR